MAEEKIPFVRMNVKSDTKREFDILAASEQRDVYAIVADALEAYKASQLGKTAKKNKRIPVVEVIATH